MIEPLALYPGAKACVNSGECCRVAPCGFGKWNVERTQCAHLTEDNLCGIAEEIVKDPSWEVSPAFGAGCCRPLFNEARNRILRERANKNARTDSAGTGAA